MRLKTLALAGIVLVAGTASAQTAAPGIAGNWRTDDNRAIITIAPCGGQMCGRISRFLVPEPAGGARDGNNPNRALRSRALLGVQVLSALTRDGAAWSGSGYSPEEGRNFRATVTPDGNRLRVRGCVAIFCRTVEWTRAR
jgi:uncharacterized protein (DUF2147 family)